MSFNPIRLRTTRSEHGASLHDATHKADTTPSRVGRPPQDGIKAASACPSARPSLSPSASPFAFTVDGCSLETRRVATPHGKRTTAGAGVDINHRSRPLSHNADRGNPTLSSGSGGNGSGVERCGGRPSTPSSKRTYHALASANSLSGLLPSATAPAVTSSPSPTLPLTMRGVSCAGRPQHPEPTTRPASAGPALFAERHKNSHSTRAASAHAKPRFNNYVVGQPTVTGLRSGSANSGTHQRPPRVPTATLPSAAATSASTSPPLTHASPSSSTNSDEEGNTPPSPSEKEHDVATDATTAARNAEAGGDYEGEEVHSRNAAVTSTVSPGLSGVFAPAPVRPLLRRLPLHTAAEPALNSITTAAAKEDTAAIGTATGSRSRSSSNSSTASPGTQGITRRPPHIPLLQMTRTFALRRPVLLTKDTSAAATAVAGSKSTPRTSPREASHAEHVDSPPPARPLDEPASSPSANAFTRFPAYTPVPPRTSLNQPRRSRRTSLLSVVGDSSATLQQRAQSADEEAVATRFFFHAMPSFTDTPDEQDSHTERAAAAVAAAGTEQNSASPVGHHAAVKVGDERSGLDKDSCISTTRLLRKDSTEQRRQQQQQRGRLADSSQHCSTPHAGVSTVVERLRERGNQYMLREEFAQAIATYTEGIRLAPSLDVLWGNRATAFLLTFRYLPAVSDCLYVLALKPGSVKAYWRCAKAYAAAYRFLDAKKYYLLAQQACLKERGSHANSVTSPGLSLTATHSGSSNSSSTSSHSRNSGTNDPHHRNAARVGTRTTDHDVAADRNRQDKAAQDAESIATEATAVGLVESYWQHVHAARWADAASVMDAVLATGRYAGPTAVSWQALRLEALLPTQPKTVLAEAESLHRTYPEALELYHVLAKALFYTVHDATSTRRSLQLLDEAAGKRAAQNTLLNVHVRYAALQLREGAAMAVNGADTAAAQLEAWGRRNQLREDSRVAELRHTIDRFVRHRDAGNAAYERGNWDAAAAAYTQCLQTDPHNHALLAAVHCNRTAVYMQAGRWRDALADAEAAIHLSPQLATAYGRRGRIQLYLLSEEYAAQRAVLSQDFTTQWSAAVKEQLLRYADAAVADLTRAVELSPTAEHKSQLQQALAQRQTVKAALNAPQFGTERQGRTGSGSGPKPYFRANGGSSSAGSSTHQHTYSRSRPPSSSSSPYGVLQQHLQLLGLNTASAAAGVLPDLKVIAKAYRESALRWHPDKWVASTPLEQQEAERKFKLISVAYASLRERYGDGAASS